MPIKDLPIIHGYNKQRFGQFDPSDTANHYIVKSETGKKGSALYPTMGRKHLIDGTGRPFVYDIQPRKIFRSIGYVYVVVGSTIYQIDSNFNQIIISDSTFTKSSGDLNFAFLPTIQDVSGASVQVTFCMLCDGTHTYVIDESKTGTGAFTQVTDTNQPPNPLYVTAFANRFVVSSRNSTRYQLSQVNLGGTYDPSTVFTIPGTTPVLFAQESGLIRQITTLHNLLFIFTDYSTGIWSNTQSVFANSTFPFKKNTSYEFDYGIADPDSLDVDFGMMTWLAQNRNGLVTFMSSNGQGLNPISSTAVNTLIQQIANASGAKGILNVDSVGFLYQYEDTVFYRVSVGPYVGFKTLDNASLANTLEYNFNTETWHRCVELNGERNRIVEHVFFVNKHIVSVENDMAIYDMSGQYYFNELQDSSSPTGFSAYPFRYENITPIISEDDYSEFITDWVQVDFVWGMGLNYSTGPYENTVFLIGERDTLSEPTYLLAEDGVSYIIKDGTNTPDLNSTFYNDLFNPHIELYWSDDGGVSFNSADVLEFSQLGIYSWRMRWYQGGPSRNRVYKLICVSAVPIVVLGGIQMVRRASGGAS